MQADKYNTVRKSGSLCFILGLFQDQVEAHAQKVLKF